MNDTWLEADGRRLQMRHVGEFGVQFAISGDVYDAGVFLVGDQTPTHDRVARLALNANDELSVEWLSGVDTSFGIMAPAFIHSATKSRGIYLHWRNRQDATLQEMTFPVTIDRPKILLSDQGTWEVNGREHGKRLGNVGGGQIRHKARSSR